MVCFWETNQRITENKTSRPRRLQAKFGLCQSCRVGDVRKYETPTFISWERCYILQDSKSRNSLLGPNCVVVCACVCR